MYEKLLLDQRGDALFVSFNNSRLHNAMDGQMLDEMIRLCAVLCEDTMTRFAVFTGKGNSFMAGVDLKSDAMSVNNEPTSARLRQRKGQELVKRLRDLEQITVAAVNGACIGAGLAVAIACDLRIAAEDSKWSLPNTSLGYFFSWGCTPLLANLVGQGRAKDLILARRQLSGTAAYDVGLAEYCVPGSALLPQSEEIVETMRAGGPIAMRMAKKLVNAASPVWFGEISTTEPELIERLYAAGESTEGNAAFLEKRPPSWNADRP
jgi:enoyl-CoA hydratase/carnithine racemase